MTTDDRLNAVDAALRSAGIMGATDLLLEDVHAAATSPASRGARIDTLAALLDVTRGRAAQVLDLTLEALG